MVTKTLYVNGKPICDYEATGDNEKDFLICQKIMKDKGLDQEAPHLALQIGRQANSFTKTANFLYENGLKKAPSDYLAIAPFVVNATFSLELFIKTMRCAYGNTPKGHHLINLYTGLPNQAKNVIAKNVVILRPDYQLIDNWEFDAELEKLSKSFEHWRYLYEFDGINVEVQSIRYLMQIFHISTGEVLRMNKIIIDI